ncbi:ring finger domain-containing protein [Phthorimaea operculella]|nr:ring finger domain-containing protein [Phthorimaea operculella]
MRGSLGEQSGGPVIHGAGHQLPEGAAVLRLRGGDGAPLHAAAVRIPTHVRDAQPCILHSAPWESKAAVLLYTELAINFLKVLLYFGFVAVMVRLYTLPLFAFRPMYETLSKAAVLLYTELAINFLKVLLYFGFVAVMVRLYTLPLFAFRPMYETLSKISHYILCSAPWESKAAVLLYTELAINFLKVLLYFGFVAVMVRLYTLPLFAFRPMYETLRSFKKAYNDVVLSRRAIRNMNTLYPDATPEELAAADNECIICREEMHTGAKKLPCNHIFHAACLRLWFQRQQTCPTCRLNVLRAPAAEPGHAAPQAPHVAANMPPAANMPRPNLPVPPPFPNMPPPREYMFCVTQAPHVAANMPPAANMPRPNLPVPPPFPNMPPPREYMFCVTQAPHVAANMPPAANMPRPNLPVPPPFPNMPPPREYIFYVTQAPHVAANMPPAAYMPRPNLPVPPPFPNMPPPQELQRMEGTERRNIEARLQLLREIQSMLDASVLLMQQYSAVVSNLPLNCTNVATQTEMQAPYSRTEPEPPATPSPVKVKVKVEPDVVPSAASHSPQPSTSTDQSHDNRDKTDADAEELRRRRLQKFTLDK